MWILGLVSLFMDLSSEMIHAVLPLYLVAVLGVSMTTVGLIEGVAEAIAQMVKLASGALSDRLGHRKWLAVAGYGVAAVTKPVFPLAASLGWIVAARFIDRIGKGIRGAPRDALIADITPDDLRGASFGLRQALDTVGAVFGPLAAMAFLAITSDSFTAVFWIAVVPAFFSVALLAGAVHEPPARQMGPEARAPLSIAAFKRLGPSYWIVVAVAAVFTLARFSEAFLLLRAQSVGLALALVPAALVLMNAVYALSAWPAGALSDRLGRHGVAVAGLAVLILADLALAWGGGILLVAIGVALWGLHMGLTQGLLSALVADTAPVEMRGIAFGMFNFLTGLATLAASVIAGLLWDMVGPAGTFVAGAVFAGLAMLALPWVRVSGAPRPA